MNLHLPLWIFICGLLLQCHCATPSPDSSILNVVIESSTSAYSDKLSKTTVHNSNDSFSLNNVDTESLHSNSANEECKNGECTKNLHTSSSTDNSSASKILWSPVSSVKSTTQSSMSDDLDFSEEITIPVYFQVNESSNNSAINNTSFRSNDNELDSEISSDNDFLDVRNTQKDKALNNLFSVDNYTSTATSIEPIVITTEILLNELENSKEENTFDEETTDLLPQTNFTDQNASDILNVTEHTMPLDIKETTIYPDDELDFTTYFADVSNSTEISSVNLLDQDITSKPYFSQNFTTEMSYYDSEALLENDNSSTLFSVDYGASAGSDELKSKSTEVTIGVDNSKAHTSSDSDNIIPTFENNTSVYPDYETSLEIEELKSKISRMVDIADVKDNLSTVISNGPTSVWTDEEKLFTIPSAVASNTNEIPTIHSEMEPTLTSEKYDTVTENKQLIEESTTESADSSHFMPTVKTSWIEMTNEDSTDITEEMSNMFNVTEEEAKTEKPTLVPNNISMFDDFDERSSLYTSEAPVSSAGTTAFNSNINSADHTSATPQSLDSYTEKNDSYSLDVSVPEGISEKTSFESSADSEFEKAKTSATIHTTDTSLIMNTMNLNTNQSISTPSSHLNSVNEINNLSSIQTNYHSISFDSSSLRTSSALFTDPSTTAFSVKTNVPEIENIINETLDKSTENIYGMITHETPVDSSTYESSDNESNILWPASTENPISSENPLKSRFTPTENFNRSTNHTEYVAGINMDKTNSVTTGESSPLPSEDTVTENVILHHSEIVKSTTTESHFYENADHTKDKISSITTRKSVTELPLENISETDSKHFDTVSMSTIYEKETSSTSTTTISTEESSFAVTETYREGKHIPFSSTLVRRTTSYPVVFNITARTHSYPPQTDTTAHNFDSLRYNRIEAAELSPEERTNLINAVVKFTDKYYNKDEMNEKMAVIHLWLLHVVAGEYKNATLNLSAAKDTKTKEIEFENLPQILYVLPTPEIFLPNISLTFVVHNRWRNETYPADIILTILNLHTENLKKVLVDIEEIHFSQGLLVQKHDLMSVIIEKYGIILLSTCLITVAMIFLLICVVIYYRKKTRHSAHCLTDNKLHRNMQEAMGIDLNPAVIILQEEIREKAALNGNKVCSLDGDEGWLAPINDVPVEDNNAPFVQDTKL